MRDTIVSSCRLSLLSWHSLFCMQHLVHECSHIPTHQDAAENRIGNAACAQQLNAIVALPLWQVLSDKFVESIFKNSLSSSLHVVFLLWPAWGKKRPFLFVALSAFSTVMHVHVNMWVSWKRLWQERGIATSKVNTFYFINFILFTKMLFTELLWVLVHVLSYRIVLQRHRSLWIKDFCCFNFTVLNNLVN